MPERKRIVSTLDIFDPGPAYKVDYHGFGGHCFWGDFDDKSEAGFLDASDLRRPWVVPYPRSAFDGVTIPDYPLVEGFLEGDRGVPSVKILPDPVSAAIIYPHMGRTAYHVDPYPGYSVDSVVASNQNVDLNYFRPFGADQAAWTDGYDGEYIRWNGCPMMYFNSSRYPSSPSGIESIFKLPAEPIFAFALWRSDPENDTGTFSGVTVVTFGEVAELFDAYALVIPQNGKPKLFYGDADMNSSGQTWLNGLYELREVTSGGGGGGGTTEGLVTVGWKAGREMAATVVWIGMFGPYVALSYDGFNSFAAVWWRTVGEPTENAPVGQFLPSGPSRVSITNVGGQFGIAWIPIFSMDYGRIYSPVRELPFDLTAMEAAGASSTYMRAFAGCPSLQSVYGGQYQFESGMLSIQKGQPTSLVIETPEGTTTDGTTRVNTDGGQRGFDWYARFRRRTYKTTIRKGTYGSDADIYGFTEWTTDPWAGLNVSRAVDRYSAVDGGGTIGTYSHDQSAVLFRVDYAKDSVLSENTGRSYTRHYPSAFNYDESKDGNVANARVDANATYAGDFSDPPFQDMYGDRSFREVMLSGAYYDGAGNLSEALDVTPGFGGYMFEPSATIEDGRVLTEVQMRDFQSFGMDVVADGTLPVFDGWRVHTAITWLLDYIGIGTNQRLFWKRYYDTGDEEWKEALVDGIEDTGAYLNIGPADKPFWLAEEGRPVVDLIAEMCVYDYGAAFYCRNGGVFKGCPHCFAARTGDISSPDYVWSHCDYGPFSTGCRASDVALSGDADGVFHRYSSLAGDTAFLTAVPTYEPLKHELKSIQFEPFDTSSYYNSVKVKGKSFVHKDEPRDVELTDWVSVHGDYESITSSYYGYILGWKKQLELSYEWANNQVIRERLARIHFDNVSKFAKRVTVTVPYDPNVHMGETFAVYGPITDYIGARGGIFRIESINHSVEAGRLPISSTLRGRFIGSVS